LSDQIYEETALKRGAVDFVEKCRSFAILRNRIDLILSGVKGGRPATDSGTAPEANGGAIFALGRLRLDNASKRAFWRGRLVELSRTEFHMGSLLASRAGRDVCYRDLYDLVHGKGFVAGTGEHGYRDNVTPLSSASAEVRRPRRWLRRDRKLPRFGYRWRRETVIE
jgi:two-component system response regulator ChvI